MALGLTRQGTMINAKLHWICIARKFSFVSNLKLPSDIATEDNRVFFDFGFEIG